MLFRSRGWTRVETVAKYDGAVMPDWSQPVGVSRTHAECQYRFLCSIWDADAKNAVGAPGIEDGVRVQHIIDAAYHSAETDRWTAVANSENQA